MNKYNAQLTIINGIKFDSKFEYKVYQALLKTVDDLDRVLVHPRLEIAPKNHFYPALTWRPDFIVVYPEVSLIVEAKGVPTEAFKLKLKIISSLKPEWMNRILFVSPVEQKIDRYFDAITVSQLMQELKKRQHFLSLSKE